MLVKGLLDFSFQINLQYFNFYSIAVNITDSGVSQAGDFGEICS